MPTSSQAQDDDQWWVNDNTPDNPYGKSEDYEAFLTYLGALRRDLTPAQAAQPIRVNVSELNNHPDYKAAAIGALESWSSTTGLQFTIVDDAPYNAATDYLQVVSPELGEQSDGSAFSSNRYVSVGQRFHDTEPDLTSPGGYVYDSFIHEFGHEWGLNHPGLYNYSGPGGVQINYLNNATWTYDRQQYSVMSYFDGIDVGEDTRWSATTPLIADIEAVQRRYFSTVDANGVRTFKEQALNTGDNVYGFGSTDQNFKLTSTGTSRDIGFVIHDTGGNDTVDFSGSTEGTVLDLRAGQFSSVNGHSNNVAIYAGHNADESDYYIEKGIGSRYADVLIGNDGNNILDGRAGADSMAGNGGDDTYFVDSIDDIVREEANGGNDTVIILNSDLDISSIANVENIVYADGSAGPQNPPETNDEPETGDISANPIIYGDADADTIDGGKGGQTIFGLDGNDLIIGGRDTLASRDINNTIPIADLEDQTETDDGDDALYGGRGNDTIIGGAGNDVLDGGSGDDVLKGQEGVDVFRGGAGIDTVDYSAESPFQLIVNLEKNFANGGTASGDTFYDIENLIGSDDRIDRFIGTSAANHFIGQGGGDVFNGRDGDDLLDGGADGDIIFGEGGNDTIIGGTGQDALDGGDGIDTLVYAGSAAGVTVNLREGTASGGDGDGPAQIVGRGTVIRHDILSNFENVTGSRFADWLIGTAGANDLSGGQGNDTLTGGAGIDTLRGGSGSDTADYSDATSGVDAHLKGSVGGDVFESIENLAGSGFNDTLAGNSSANVLTGFGGNDRIGGESGDDILLGDFDTQVAPIPQPGRGTGYATLGTDAANNSTATAFDVSNNFSLTSDADIFDSTSVLHTTVNATGNGKAGYYKLDLAAGAVVSVDIDRITSADFDSYVRLLDSNGNVVAENDDGAGDPGSSLRTDSSLSFVVQTSGTYYVQQGSWQDGAPGNGFVDIVPDGEKYEVNISVDSPEPPAAPGTGGADTLYGDRGDDLLDGGLAKDLLIGGQGADSFRFSTALSASNVDQIRDFSVTDDQIILDQRIFSSVGSAGQLTFSAFYSSTTGTAHDATDRIVYDTDSGYLTYDADGTGSGAAVRFARLSTGLNLSADDFFII